VRRLGQIPSGCGEQLNTNGRGHYRFKCKCADPKCSFSIQQLEKRGFLRQKKLLKTPVGNISRKGILLKSAEKEKEKEKEQQQEPTRRNLISLRKNGAQKKRARTTLSNNTQNGTKTTLKRTTDCRKASDAVGQIMWPKVLTVEEVKKLTITCVIFSFEEEGCLVLSADCKGLNGDGDSKEEALKDFQENVKEAINDRIGGIFPETCDATEQMKLLSDIIDEWRKDGIKIISTEIVEIRDF